jgi:hypothetical protein
VARYELASGCFSDSPEIVEGVISLNCIPNNVDEIFTGEELLSRFVNYTGNNPSQYTIENVLRSLDLANVKIPSNWEQPIARIDTGAELFVGYILLDTFANNSDRHDHNWSIMSVDDRLELVPSYDHGLSLGSTDEDEDKLKLELSDYVNRYSQSCFQEGYNKVPNLTVFDRAAKLYPEAAQIWLERLKAITPEQISEIFDRIPEGRITPVAATFAKNLLAYNQTELLKRKSLGNEPVALKDLNNYSDYLKSKEYAQTLPTDERIDLGRKANDIIDPLRNDWRNKGRAQTGVNMHSTDPFFQTFETELDLTEKDQAGMEMAREWASMQPKIKKNNEGQDRSQGR